MIDYVVLTLPFLLLLGLFVFSVDKDDTSEVKFSLYEKIKLDVKGSDRLVIVLMILLLSILMLGTVLFFLIGK